MWNRVVVFCLFSLPGLNSAVSLSDINDSMFSIPVELSESGVLIIENAIEQDLIDRLSDALVDCSLKDVDTDLFVSTTLDGSLRATFASKSNSQFDQCSEQTQELVEIYKLRTDAIGLKVARFLDKQHIINGPKIESLISSSQSASLDHFHIYRRTSKDDRAPNSSLQSVEHSIPFHVDMGLFLLLTPAQWVGASIDVSGIDTDLVVKRKDGSTFQVAPENPGSVILLFGAGLTNWLYRGSSGLRAAVHAVNPIPKISGGSRVVLGRMYLPPMNSVSDSGIRFEDFFMSSSKVVREEPVDQSSAQWRRLMEARCEAGTKYCWMDCMPDVDCGEEIESMCMNQVTGKVCLETDCDTDCTVMCPARPATLAPTPASSDQQNSTNMSAPTSAKRRSSQPPVPVAVTVANDPVVPFCRGGTSMVMSGFESVGSTNANCIILFFRPWLLDSPWKFGIGCLGVFLLGVLVEAAIKLRRFATNKMKVHSRFWREFVVISLFAVNVSLGYLCMLAAMTFNVEIFISTVMGLAVGHLLLGNSAEPVRETADPCCVTSEATNTAAVSTSLVNSTGACCCDTRPR